MKKRKFSLKFRFLPLTAGGKRILRRTGAFFLLFVVYMIISYRYLIEADLYSSHFMSFSAMETIGYIAIIAAYMMLVRQLRQETAADKVQDSVLAKAVRCENGRRFTLCAERCEHIENGLRLHGRLFGEVLANDVVYLYCSKNRTYPAKVTSVTFLDESQTVPSNRFVIIDIQLQGNLHEESFPVLSSIIPFIYRNSSIPVENARLLGLVQAFPYLHEQNEFLFLFSEAVRNGRYLICAQREEKTSAKAKVRDLFFPYQGLYKFTAVEKSDDARQAFPVYTDWDAYSRITLENDPEKKTEALVFSFAELAPMVGSENIVINPFGPQSAFLSSELIRRIQ